ncbi:MAG: hypothetical protein M1832_006077 [Thelocarpon impressellum]|nr:MAG: hypothetical protein M1832_006077 [Thelocarpon impressellum]
MRFGSLSLLLCWIAAFGTQAKAGAGGGGRGGGGGGRGGSGGGGSRSGGGGGGGSGWGGIGRVSGPVPARAAAAAFVATGNSHRYPYNGAYFSSTKTYNVDSGDNRYQRPKGWVDCNVVAKGNIDSTAMTECHEAYRNGKDNWDGKNCADLGWFKGRMAYENADNCFDACWECLAGAIGHNATSAQCENKITEVSKCWMGWHET